MILSQLITALLSPLALVLVRRYMHDEARMAVLSELALDKAETILLSAEGLSTALRDHGKELELNGTMFDIVTLTTSGTQVVVTAIRDDAETSLKLLIEKTHLGRMNNDSRVASLYSILCSLQIPAVITNISFITDLLISKIIIIEFPHPLLPIHLSPEPKPPEL